MIANNRTHMHLYIYIGIYIYIYSYIHIFIYIYYNHHRFDGGDVSKMYTTFSDVLLRGALAM